MAPWRRASHTISTTCSVESWRLLSSRRPILLLDRDRKMLDLRSKWLEKFQKAVPAKVAARAIQLDRRLSNVAQIQLSQQIPLVH